MSVLCLALSNFRGMLQHCQHPPAYYIKGLAAWTCCYALGTLTCQCLSNHERCIEKEWPYMFSLSGSMFS